MIEIFSRAFSTELLVPGLFFFPIPGKIGYGTVSEAMAYKVPFIFIRRDYFNEEPYLREMLEVQLDAYQICYSCSFHGTSSNQLGSYLHMFCVNSITKVVWRWPEEICSVDVGYPTLNVLLTWNHAMREVPMVVRYTTFFNPILYLLWFMAFIKNSWHQKFSPWWFHTKTFEDLSLCNQEIPPPPFFFAKYSNSCTQARSNPWPYFITKGGIQATTHWHMIRDLFRKNSFFWINNKVY